MILLLGEDDDMNSDLCILVVSCDGYADIWDLFFTLFWKFWSDCPYPVYLGANQKVYSDKQVMMALTGDDPGWAESTRRMVEQIPTDYILMLLEDFFLQEKVDTQEIESNFDALKILDGGYLRLKPFPKPDRKVPGYPDIGEIEPGAPYRTALQAAIWRKDVLTELLVDGESAWDMELKGSRRSDNISVGFYSTWKPILHYEAGVTMGKWIPWAVEQACEEGVLVDLALRPELSKREYLKWKLRRYRSSIIKFFPWKYRRAVGYYLRRLNLMPNRS
jgi:hypothetical protein